MSRQIKPQLCGFIIPGIYQWRAATRLRACQLAKPWPAGCSRLLSKLAVQLCSGTGCYGDFKRALGLLPGAGCTYPTNLQRTPSIFLPFSNLVERHDMTSPLAASSNIWMRTFASEKPVAIAISESSLSPCIFRYCKISFMDSFPETSVVWREVYTY